MKITRVERLALDIPFYARRVTRAMHRAQTHDERVYVYRVETDGDLIGYGESYSRPSGGAQRGPDHHDAERLLHKNPFDLLHDHTIGQGPHLAVLDLCGKAAGVPVHALIGSKIRDHCPLSWWDLDMPPADWAAEARESVRRGYTSFKMKARPWFDIFAQVEAVAQVVPADYKFDLDFNGFLLDAARAEVTLSALDEYPHIDMYESPFYLYKDLDGARLLRQQTRNSLIEHFDQDCLRADCCDGFVLGGHPLEIMRQGTLAAASNKPFWIQHVGTGITTAYVAHLYAVLSHAQLPGITAHELWEHDLLMARLYLQNGYLAIPDAPGLGVEIDEKALATYQVDEDQPTPKTRYRRQKRILEVSWPGAGRKRRRWAFTDETRCQAFFYAGNLPGFERGVKLRVVEDDGSNAFSRRHMALFERGL